MSSSATRVRTTAALLCQQPFDAESADKLVELLEMAGDTDASALQEVPMCGSFGQLPLIDSTIYRSYEALQILRAGA